MDNNITTCVTFRGDDSKCVSADFRMSLELTPHYIVLPWLDNFTKSLTYRHGLVVSLAVSLSDFSKHSTLTAVLIAFSDSRLTTPDINTFL